MEHEDHSRAAREQMAAKGEGSATGFSQKCFDSLPHVKPPGEIEDNPISQAIREGFTVAERRIANLESALKQAAGALLEAEAERDKALKVLARIANSPLEVFRQPGPVQRWVDATRSAARAAVAEIEKAEGDNA